VTYAFNFEERPDAARTPARPTTAAEAVLPAPTHFDGVMGFLRRLEIVATIRTIPPFATLESSGIAGIVRAWRETAAFGRDPQPPSDLPVSSLHAAFGASVLSLFVSAGAFRFAVIGEGRVSRRVLLLGGLFVQLRE
jgi:hypothetical protein